MRRFHSDSSTRQPNAESLAPDYSWPGNELAVFICRCRGRKNKRTERLWPETLKRTAAGHRCIIPLYRVRAQTQTARALTRVRVQMLRYDHSPPKSCTNLGVTLTCSDPWWILNRKKTQSLIWGEIFSRWEKRAVGGHEICTSVCWLLLDTPLTCGFLALRDKPERTSWTPRIPPNGRHTGFIHSFVCSVCRSVAARFRTGPWSLGGHHDTAGQSATRERPNRRRSLDETGGRRLIERVLMPQRLPSNLTASCFHRLLKPSFNLKGKGPDLSKPPASCFSCVLSSLCTFSDSNVKTWLFLSLGIIFKKKGTQDFWTYRLRCCVVSRLNLAPRNRRQAIRERLKELTPSLSWCIPNQSHFVFLWFIKCVCFVWTKYQFCRQQLEKKGT